MNKYLIHLFFFFGAKSTSLVIDFNEYKVFSHLLFSYINCASSVQLFTNCNLILKTIISYMILKYLMQYLIPPSRVNHYTEIKKKTEPNNSDRLIFFSLQKNKLVLRQQVLLLMCRLVLSKLRKKQRICLSQSNNS